MENITNIEENNKISFTQKISRFFKKIYTFIFKKHLKISIFIIIIIIIAGYFANKQENKNIEIGKLTTGNLEEVVTVSGDIEASQESTLSFEKSGRIININAKVGDKVIAGQKLASLNDANDAATVLSARAQLSQAEANLADVANGPSQADLSVKQDSLNSARNNLVVSNSSVHDLIFNVNQSLSDILKNKLGSIFSNSLDYYTLSYQSCDQTSASKIETERKNLDKDLANTDALLNNFSLIDDNELDASTKNSLDIESGNSQTIDKALSSLSASTKNVSSFLDDLNNLFTLSCSISDNSLNGQRNTISNARASISSVMSSISSTKSQILNYRGNYSSALSSLNQLKAGATSEKVKSLSAQVESARANLAQAIANQNKNFLIAPFDGVITQININLGEISSSNASAISLVSDNNFEMKIKLAEIDAVKVKVLNKAKITLDTYGDSVIFNGTISQLDPAATIEGGVSNYYGKISFDNDNQDLDKIKIGMNGNADIVVSQRQNVNYIDSRYIKINGSSSYVKVIKDLKKLKDTTNNDNDSNIEIREIITGMRGSNGKIEVISGITKEDNLYPFGTEVLTASSTSK